MKLLFLLLAGSLLLTGSQKMSKKELLCQKWKKVAIKFTGKMQQIPTSQQGILTINPDGTFTDELYAIGFGEKKYHKEIEKGQWKFSSDSSHLAFKYLAIDDDPLDRTSFASSQTPDSIIKLTKDQLIYAIPAFNVDKHAWGYHYHYYVKAKN